MIFDIISDMATTTEAKYPTHSHIVALSILAPTFILKKSYTEYEQ
ncbi:hypothetical protein swp_4432 [Shewanella piezotolerans WP3]|uniref:Uncharacterized protein n=1 Tax=Shewanella piezotolerans (strain WP3 / JCM 13877) TaxID=225849 RepID=B8CTG7_SHEPW|nr:hypothetical protein swp_4432 [Shewanella piezotolerans WP3]